MFKYKSDKGKAVKIRYCPATVNPKYCHDHTGHCSEIIGMGRRSWLESQETLSVLNCRLTREGWGDRKRYCSK